MSRQAKQPSAPATPATPTSPDAPSDPTASAPAETLAAPSETVAAPADTQPPPPETGTTQLPPELSQKEQTRPDGERLPDPTDAEIIAELAKYGVTVHSQTVQPNDEDPVKFKAVYTPPEGNPQSMNLKSDSLTDALHEAFAQAARKLKRVK